MNIWVEAQLSPHLAPWLNERFGVEACSVRWLGYRDASDEAIFVAAREAGAAVMTKDHGFLNLLDIHGPPKVIWIKMCKEPRPTHPLEAHLNALPHAPLMPFDATGRMAAAISFAFDVYNVAFLRGMGVPRGRCLSGR